VSCVVYDCIDIAPSHSLACSFIPKFVRWIPSSVNMDEFSLACEIDAHTKLLSMWPRLFLVARVLILCPCLFARVLKAITCSSLSTEWIFMARGRVALMRTIAWGWFSCRWSARVIELAATSLEISGREFLCGWNAKSLWPSCWIMWVGLKARALTISALYLAVISVVFAPMAITFSVTAGYISRMVLSHRLAKESPMRSSLVFGRNSMVRQIHYYDQTQNLSVELDFVPLLSAETYPVSIIGLIDVFFFGKKL
jgi:hypothetical protein